ncbi:YtxH domain-containing protein [Hymenobacter caeli]|uniref:Gas vesicle protein n=1 Tax=Hymenobacter caeli TaxID=2735894 RepID=A0ABX2FJT6_9BACT|nr:YtxH domain-containing protein [Hymenobacter caeli]NRT17380.1 gas vesicle protein [Hymenobacter caeli]
MKDDPGKVIFSLLAGATAGIVAGLLLAPETGDDARAQLRVTATKLADDLKKRARQALGQPLAAAPTPHADDQAAADALLHAMSAEAAGALD